MLVPEYASKDSKVPVITIGLDGQDTQTLKKFKCSICGGTVFGYYDTLRFLLPGDATKWREEEKFKKAKALDQIECTHYYYIPELNMRKRCHTLYIILRGNFEISNG